MDWPVCKYQVFGKFAQTKHQKVNKHPKFWCQLLEHFKYDMNHTSINFLEQTTLQNKKLVFGSHMKIWKKKLTSSLL